MNFDELPPAEQNRVREDQRTMLVTRLNMLVDECRLQGFVVTVQHVVRPLGGKHYDIDVRHARGHYLKEV